MPNVWRDHEFEALRCRFENQTDQLHRMTVLDFQVFSGYITLQMALGAWLATHELRSAGLAVRSGVLMIDCVLAVVATALIYNSYRRRQEVAAIVRNCGEALGYETAGVYLPDRPLNVTTQFRPWKNWYFVGIAAGMLGLGLILFGSAATCCFHG